MKKLKLMTIVGTRPEIIKMSAIIKKSDKYFNHVLVHTGQNYDYNLNEVFFKDLGLREPDYYLGVVGANIGETMGNVISKAYNLMVEVKPDAVIHVLVLLLQNVLKYLFSIWKLEIVAKMRIFLKR